MYTEYIKLTDLWNEGEYAELGHIIKEENWSLSKNIWTLVAILAGPFWELMQQIGWVRGQYDVKDIAAYLIFSLIAVLLAKMVNR